ncbi:MAG: AtpZ/AtpI family protein [Cyanothece sp. SIO1E1]|nr:AtpZ/AtpI family protein [Cyanothece sp. SIO1E1]
MAFQMAAILIVGALAGRELDERFQTERPYFTLILVIFAIIGAFYLTLKDFIFAPNAQGKDDKEKDE